MEPTPLVSAFQTRSVPTARDGRAMPSRISAGVINAPPPIPVNPTMKPTTNPSTLILMSKPHLTKSSKPRCTRVGFCSPPEQSSIPNVAPAEAPAQGVFFATARAPGGIEPPMRVLLALAFSLVDRSRASPHHKNLSPNWICRELVVVEVINPVVGDAVADATPVAGSNVAAVKTIGLGVLKFA